MLIFFHRPAGSESILPNLSILAALPAASGEMPAEIALGLLGIALLVRGRSALADTTLVAAWWWALAALVTLSVTMVMLAGVSPDASAKLRQSLEFAAAMTTFCPLMAMLGAKRPQSRAWQWIVLSLWVVLALPSGEWLLFNTGTEIHAARSWFLLVLIGLGALNYVLTRFWPASLLFAAGQVLLLARFLPAGGYVSPLSPPVALGLIVAALATAAWLPRHQHRAQQPLDRLWRDFRNLYGAVWGLRVAERINASAGQNGWPVRLDWSGFRILADPAGAPDSADNSRTLANSAALAPDGPLAKNLRSQLLPFVSTQWIARRLEPDEPS